MGDKSNCQHDQTDQKSREPGSSMRGDCQPDQTSREPGSSIRSDCQVDQTCRGPGSSIGSDCQADQTSMEPGSSITTTGSSSKTHNITRCHTRKWPVARYVKFPNSSPNVQTLTFTNPGNKPPDGDQAEQGMRGRAEHQCRAEMIGDARDQAEQCQARLTTEQLDITERCLDRAEQQSNSPDDTRSSADPRVPKPLHGATPESGPWRGM